MPSIVKILVVAIHLISCLITILSLSNLALYKTNKEESYVAHFLAVLVASALFFATIGVMVAIP